MRTLGYIAIVVGALGATACASPREPVDVNLGWTSPLRSGDVVR